MKEIELEISFVTPAFLGNASQNSQWRTPPFKTLLRQWWRVVKAKDVDYDYKKLLIAENELFGTAADGCKSTRSALRLKLDNWNNGKLSNVDQGTKVKHPEVKDKKGNVVPIGSQLYLGYGPVTTRGIKDGNNAIAPLQESATLWLGFPDRFFEEIKQTIQLINWFGTLGSRSRNGWGSIMIKQASNMELKPINQSNLMPFCRDLSACLQKDWAHAVGHVSNNPLLWQTNPKATWEEVMKDLAEIKIAFRTNFHFPHEKPPHSAPEKRHIIAYPVTKHGLDRLGNNARLANQIRFKVQKTEKDQYRALIVHLPCQAPERGFLDKLSSQNKSSFKKFAQEVWPAIHQILDQNSERLK
ncbi:MAG: CRISPR-associated protein Cmr1 [Clostridiales bacterium]|nr:CRISPR-associated protein Cmr1 [Clostridiales bacterium]MDN5282459.1 CRISPR-associated protein Cmr1 [Candidatus Ozemobacter sp.]